MIQVVAVLLVLLSVPLLGGTIANLGGLRLRSTWAAPLAVVLQVVLTDVSIRLFEGPIGGAMHLVTYALAVWFVIANRHIRGLWLIALGGLANLIAITANGGVMPASPSAARIAGIEARSDRFENSKVVEHARFAVLGDIFAVPASLPFANVFSMGDVLLIAGIGYVVHAGSGSRLGAIGKPSPRRAT